MAPQPDVQRRFLTPSPALSQRDDRSNPIRLTVLAIIAGLVAAALLGSAAPVGKSGERRTQTLDLAVPDPLGSQGAAVAELFARAVGARSGGSLHIRISAAPSGATDPDDRADAAALAAVRSGRSPLAIVPVESLRAVGVTSFAAIDVPFLVDSDELAARVTAGPLAARLQSGLPAVALAGLGLIPESLYRTFGFLKPLVTPADYAGVEVRAPRSAAIRAALRVLGARPVASDSPGPGSAILAGFGGEIPAGSGGSFPQNAYTAANLAVLPKIDVVVASLASLRRLPPWARTALREAAADTRRQTIEPKLGAGDEAAFCQNGGSVVAAPAGAAAALRARAASVIEVQADPATRRLIANIGRLAVSYPSSGAGCGESSVPVSEPAFGRYGQLLRNRLLVSDGTYRHVFVPVAGTPAASDRSGVATLVVTGERTRGYRFFEIQWQAAPASTCRGRIGIVDREDLVRWNPLTPCSGRLALTWRGERGDLRIDADRDRSDLSWSQGFSGVWKRAYPSS